MAVVMAASRGQINEDENERNSVRKSPAMKHWRPWLISAFTIIVGVFAYFILSSLDSTQTYEGTEMSGEAPAFRLTDQNSSVINLSDFRGKVVILTFMDSKCEDTCPLTAAQLRQAYQQLDQIEAGQVAFIGVNVNIEAYTITDISEITKTWRLDEIPSWHFLTGSREELEPVWKDYAIAVEPLPDGTAIMHTPGVFLIDPSGQKRWYLSTVYSKGGSTGQGLPLSDLLVKHIRKILRES